jgi:hypothetical protein
MRNARNSKLVTLGLLLILLLCNIACNIASAVPLSDVTLGTQPPADASDCQASIEDATGVGWINNGYVKVSFNTTTELDSITFYRGAAKVLMLDLCESYLNVSEIEQPTPDQIPLEFYKLQWANYTGEGGWEDWTVENPIPDNYFAYRQQIVIRAIWQDDPDDPWYILTALITITRGMPYVQTGWIVTNLFGGTRNIEFIPCGVFYLSSNRTILTSDLSAWNETTGLTYGNAWANDTWFAVGFTAVDTDAKVDIQLFDETQETLTPSTYQAINGHSTAANWTQSFSTLPYEYNYTFILNSTNTAQQWCTAELWTPQDVDSVAFYYSTDEGETWTAGISYNFTDASGDATGFQTMDSTDVNATIYDVGTADFYHLTPTVDPVISTTNAEPSSYTYTDLLGVYDRVAFGVELPDDASGSACYIKAQVIFTGAARFYLEYDDSREPFDEKPEQDYNLVNQTGSELYFVTANSTTSAWAIGMNQTLSHLRVTNYANGSLQNVLFSWSQTLGDEESAGFLMNVFGFPSINTNTAGIFRLNTDSPRFQLHEALVLTIFSTLQTYWDSANGRRVYVLNWTQILVDTPWDSVGNYTVALVEYDRASNGWHPLTSPTWLFRRSSSPIVDTFDSSELTGIAFYLTKGGGTVPPSGAEEPTTPPTPTAAPPFSITGISGTDIMLAGFVVAVIAIIAVAVYVLKKP